MTDKVYNSLEEFMNRNRVTYKIIAKSDVPSEIRFKFTQYALGDHTAKYAVVDLEVTMLYYIGSIDDCLSYVDDRD